MADETSECTAYRMDGEICGRPTEPGAFYCFIHRDSDPWRGAKDIADYIRGGIEFAVKTKEVLVFITILIKIVSENTHTPMAAKTLDDLEDTQRMAELCSAMLEDQEGKPHSQEDAEGIQSLLSVIVDRIDAARKEMDQFVSAPVPPGSKQMKSEREEMEI